MVGQKYFKKGKRAFGDGQKYTKYNNNLKNSGGRTRLLLGGGLLLPGPS